MGTRRSARAQKRASCAVLDHVAKLSGHCCDPLSWCSTGCSLHAEWIVLEMHCSILAVSASVSQSSDMIGVTGFKCRLPTSQGARRVRVFRSKLVHALLYTLLPLRCRRACSALSFPFPCSLHTVWGLCRHSVCFGLPKGLPVWGSVPSKQHRPGRSTTFLSCPSTTIAPQPNSYNQLFTSAFAERRQVKLVQ